MFLGIVNSAFCSGILSVPVVLLDTAIVVHSSGDNCSSTRRRHGFVFTSTLLPKKTGKQEHALGEQAHNNPPFAPCRVNERHTDVLDGHCPVCVVWRERAFVDLLSISSTRRCRRRQ